MMKVARSQKISKIVDQFQNAQAALKQGSFSIAEKHLNAILKLNPNHIEARAHLAYVYSAAKNYDKAIKTLKLLLSTNCNVAQTHHNIGVCFYEQKSYQEAAKHYRSALDIEPDRIDTLINFAVCLRLTSQYDDAAKSLRIVLDLDKTNTQALHLLGIIFSETKHYNLALNCLERAIKLAPNNSVYKLCFANVLELAELQYEAEIQYHQCCELNPQQLDAFIIYGNFLLKHRYYDQALECFLWAEKLLPKLNDQFKNTDVIQFIGKTYLGLGDTDAAIAKLKSAIEIYPNNLDIYILLGQAYQESGKVHEATELARNISNLESKPYQGYVLLSKVKKSNTDDQLADQLLNHLSNNLGKQDQAHIHFALGKIYNDQRNYKAAFEHYKLGNSIENEFSIYSKEEDEARTTELIDFFDDTIFEKLEHLGNNSNLPVLIVGMPRSGTTLTEQIISSHPMVAGAGEVYFWGGALNSVPLRLKTEMPYPQCIAKMNPQQAEQICKLYEEMIKKVAGGPLNLKHITDKMPHNFLNIGLIALLFPNIKIIHTRRDPVDTCLSIYFQHFYVDGHSYAFDLANIANHYKQYERIMRHWHKVLPGRIFDIHYENIVSDTEYWSRKLISHIGLRWNNACLAPHELERTIKTASHWQVRQPIYKTSTKRWKNYEPYIGELIDTLNQKM